MFVVVNILLPHIFICLHAALLIEIKTFKTSSCVSLTPAIKESTRKTNLDFEAPKDRPCHNGSLKRGVITGVGKRPHLTMVAAVGLLVWGSIKEKT